MKDMFNLIGHISYTIMTVIENLQAFSQLLVKINY